MKKLLIFLNAIIFISSYSINFYQYDIPATQKDIGDGDIVYDTRNDTRYNGTSFDLNGSGSSFDVLFKDDSSIDYLNQTYHAFQNMKFVGIDPNNKNIVRLKKFSTGGPVGSDPTYYTERIILENVILKPYQLDLIMKGTKGYSQIDMYNSEIDMSDGKLMLNPGDTFILNSIRNSNKINNWNYSATNDFDVSILPNSELIFSNSSLNLNGEAIIDVNSGKLTIEGDSSKFLMEDKGSLVDLISSELLVKDTNVTVKLQNLTTDFSKITVDGVNTKLNLSGTSTIKNTKFSLEKGSIQVDKMNISGANSITLENNTSFNILDGASNGVLVVNNLKGGTFKSSNFDIDGGIVFYNGRDVVSENDLGTTNINNGTLQFKKGMAFKLYPLSRTL